MPMVTLRQQQQLLQVVNQLEGNLTGCIYSDTAGSDDAVADLKQAFDNMNQTEEEPPADKPTESDASENNADVTKEDPPSNDRG